MALFNKINKSNSDIGPGALNPTISFDPSIHHYLDKELHIPTEEKEPEPKEEWIWVEGYKGTDIDMCCRGYQYELGKRFDIEKVIFNGPATIVMWMDGTKTIVKCQDGDEFDPEKGLAMAISKKAFGNKGNYCDVFKKCLEDCNIHYETINTDPRAGDIYNAQQRLHNALHDTKATKRDLIAAMKEAVGYLDHTHIDQNYIK